jgi:hypothetical protein
MRGKPDSRTANEDKTCAYCPPKAGVSIRQQGFSPLIAAHNTCSYGRDHDRPSGGPYLDSTTVYEHMTKLVGFNPVVIEMLNVITQQQRLMDVLRTWLNLRLL